MDKGLNGYMEKRAMDSEKYATRTLYISAIIGIIYTAIKYCIVGIILFAVGRYLGVW